MSLCDRQAVAATAIDVNVALMSVWYLPSFPGNEKQKETLTQAQASTYTLAMLEGSMKKTSNE